MKLELRSRRVNGAGELRGTVAVLSDSGALLFEDSINLSKSRQREALIREVARRAKTSEKRVRQAMLKLLEEQRSAHLREAGQEAPPRERKADKLVEALLVSGVELFADQYGEPHIAMPEGERRAIYRVRSTAFRDRLANLGYVAMGEVPSTEAVRAALAVIAGKAVYEGQGHRLHVRTAWHERTLWYDLGRGRAVQVSPGSWEVVERPPLLFRSFPHQVPQVEPAMGGDLKEFLGLVRLPGSHAELLTLTDLVAGLLASIPRPVSIYYGPHGSTKTSALRFRRMLQDPVEVPVQGPPRDIGECIQLASHNLCLFLDNLTALPPWLSDALSRFCTGDGFVKRALYTTDEDFVYRPQGVGGITGVNLVVTAPDLLDRALIYQMDRLPDGDFVPERELQARFEAIRPGLLGAMFTALAEAMRIHPRLAPRRLPRLADYAQWGCAVAIASGFSESDYWAAYSSNVGAQTREALDASPVAQAVLALMKERDRWSGTPAELLSELNQVASSLGIDTTGRAWPKDATWVVRRLMLVVPNLAQTGVRVVAGWSGKQRSVTLQRPQNSVGAVGSVGDRMGGQLGATNATNTKFPSPQDEEASKMCQGFEAGQGLPPADDAPQTEDAAIRSLAVGLAGRAGWPGDVPGVPISGEVSWRRWVAMASIEKVKAAIEAMG